MSLKNSIKLVGVDLDGTLLTDDKTLCDGTVDMINSLSKRGIHFVPITGRPFSGIPTCIKEIDKIEYAITSNGSQIIEMKSEKSIFSFPISNEKTLEIINILEADDCMYEAFADNVGYIKKEEFEQHKKRFSGTPFGEYLFASRRVVPSIKALFDGTEKQADEIFILCDSAEIRDNLARKMDKISGIQLCLIADKFLEITKENVDKGEALATLCNHLCIDLGNTIAFGDGENDLQFLTRAGVAVAMENAVPCVKEKADIITKSNNNNGVLEILRQI